ncbi:AP2-like ethylene-responsive transcription factor [Apostasia shenzhenica]|uniref:AP2-like ethylene-responsive transcription factor n=1 Tax=Apostasia shenzhenica TaxID=1088818 RepID=A0A2I0B486_9ASPA|nr:AP2-like ethylene-responsive transcription factor [Apostasia shenzhenica]
MIQGSSRDPTTEGKLPAGFGMDRKIDLTSYIRWWAPKKSRQPEPVSTNEDVSRELRALESSVQANEPYKLPLLGLPQKEKKKQPQAQTISACSILSKSAAFSNFMEKVSQMEDNENDASKEAEMGKSVPHLFASSELDSSGMGMGFDELPVQRSQYSLSPLLTAPLRTPWNAVDPMPDPIFWTSLVPPDGQSLNTPVTSLPTNPVI